MSAAWAIIASFILPDFPANTKRLSDRERELAVLRILDEGATVASEDMPQLSHMEALKLALKNWKTWAFTVGYMVTNTLLRLLVTNKLRLIHDDRPGHRRFFNPHILLPYPGELPRLQLHRSTIHDRPHLRRGLRLHRNNLLLHRQSHPPPGHNNRRLARHINALLHNHLHRI